MMSCVKKTYAFKGQKMVSFSGHISTETAKKRGYEAVTLCIFDLSGKGRGEAKRFFAPNFLGMRAK